MFAAAEGSSWQLCYLYQHCSQTDSGDVYVESEWEDCSGVSIKRACYLPVTCNGKPRFAHSKYSA